MNTNEAPGKDFIRHIVATDVEEGRHGGRVQTRFPPEPNGYLHIGHAKAICLDFEIAQEFNGQCYMRFDDTNPEKEHIEYVEAIKEDVRWLGYDWGDRLAHASDYFQENLLVFCMPSSNWGAINLTHSRLAPYNCKDYPLNLSPSCKKNNFLRSMPLK